jgi:ribosome-dependent ATPase
MSQTPEVVIETRKLSRQFARLVAVDRLDLRIEHSSIFGLLGPNGSGKSTIIRMLCGVLSPSSGSGRVLGYDIQREAEAIKRRIGYMSQRFSLYNDLSVAENLEFYGRIYGLRRQRLADRTDAVLELTGLRPRLDQLTAHLSGGWKQRLALASALIHEPDILFLDEPTAGIDPVARRELWDLLFGLAADGKTLFVTTHYMDEAERCSHVGYIYQSRLIASGRPAELKQLPAVNPPGTRRLELRCPQPARQLTRLRRLPGVRDATLFGEAVHLLVRDDLSSEELRDAVQPAQGPAELREIQPSLEDVFVTLSNQESRRLTESPTDVTDVTGTVMAAGTGGHREHAAPAPKPGTDAVPSSVAAGRPRRQHEQPLRGLTAMFLKELTHVRRDKATLVFMFVIPLIQLTLFGFALDTQIRQIPTVVYNLDGRAESQRLVESFANTQTFLISRMASDEATFRHELTSGRAKVGIRIPPDYSDKLLRNEQAQVGVLIDGSDAQVANAALTAAKLLGVNKAMRQMQGGDPIWPVTTARDGAGHAAASLDVRPRLLFNPDLLSERFFVPGLVGIILQLVTLFLTTFAITREREMGTLEQLFVTPVGRVALLLGKLAPYGIVGVVEMVLVLNVMVFLFQVPIQGSLLLLLGLSILFMFCGLGLGLLISTFARNQAQAIQLAFLVMLPSVLLSGFMFPRDNMPLPIYAVSHLFPVTYYIEILRGIILRAADARDLMQWILGLLASALVIVGLSLWRFQKSLD